MKSRNSFCQIIAFSIVGLLVGVAQGGAIGWGDFSGNENWIDFSDWDHAMTNPVYYEGCTFTELSGSGWRDYDYTRFFQNGAGDYPGLSLGYTMNDEVGETEIKVEFTDYTGINRVGILASTNPSTTYKLEAFDADDHLLESLTGTMPSSEYPVWLGLETTTPIRYIVLTEPGGDNGYVGMFDDLRFEVLETYALKVTPAEGFTCSGDEGGPFTPECKTYTLTNDGPNSLDWTATKTQLWLNVTPGSGTLVGGASTTVDVCINANANTLAPGDYHDTVTFTNTTSGIPQMRHVTLQVRVPGVIFYDDFESGTDNWSLDYPWGLTTSTYNSPTHSLTDSPYGNYSNYRNISATLIPEIDLSNCKSAVLEFQTKYFTESCCDRCYVEVSSDGGPWSYIPPYLRGTQSSWIKKPYSLNHFLGQNIRIRFRLYTDYSVTYDGWYIDDVCVTCVPRCFLVVMPEEGFVSDGNEGGPFWPDCNEYTLTNTSPNSLDWDVEVACPWLDVEPNSGTLQAETNTVVEVSINELANDLEPNIYTCEIIFSDLTNDCSEIRNATLEVYAVPGEIEVSDSIPPVNDLNMPFGEVIVGLSRTEQVTIANIDLNTRHELVVEAIYLSPAIPEFTLILPPGGPQWTVESDANIIVDVNFTPTDFTDYESTLVIKSDDRDEPLIELQLSGTGIPEYLHIVPVNDVNFSGHPGGPFVPTYVDYNLTNNGPIPVDWTAEPNVLWLDVSPSSGTLDPCESTTVTVQPNSQADLLSEGYWPGDVNFTDVTTTLPQKRRVILNVYTEPKIWANPYSFNVTVTQGRIQTQVLTIGNTGGSPLEFALSSHQTDFTPPQDQGPDGDSVLAESDIVVSAPPGHDFTVLAEDAAFAPGELLVRFAPLADSAGPNVVQVQRNAILTSLGGGHIVREYEIVPGLCLVKLPDGITMEDALLSFNQTDGILYAQPNYELKVDSDQQYIPNDPSFNLQWNMHNTGQIPPGGTPDADIDAPEAWDIATGSSEIIVAVIDTGVDYTHPDLAANMWTNEAELNGTPGFDDDDNGYVDDIYGYDFATYEGVRDPDPMDDVGHGSHCAGIIGAVGNNAEGVAGVHWNVKIMALKFMNPSIWGGSGYTSDEIACIEYSVLMGANLSNNSYGGTGYNQAEKDAIDAARAAGILFVAAAGNDGTNNDRYSHYPSSYDCENIIAVLSTDCYDTVPSYSNYGLTSVDLGAPGGDYDYKIYSCWKNGGYYYAYGTSMAAPHVAGACALVWSMCPSLSHLDVKDIILETVDPLVVLDGLCVTGGRLNLYEAILEVPIQPPSGDWIEFIPEMGTIAAGGEIDVNVIFNAERDAGTYQGWINISSNDPYEGNLPIEVTMTVEPIDYFTELFDPNYLDPNDPNYNDMANRTLTFRPDGSCSYYRLCSDAASGFPVDPNGGTVVSLDELDDDDYIPVDLNGASINFYGYNYDTFYIGSNGYISFISGDISHFETLADHFDLPRISALFDDLDPSAGGLVSWKQLDDRVVVTFQNVPEYSLYNSNSFQIEMRFNGKIRITFLDIAANDGLVGLSEGYGLPQWFTQSDLSEYNLCNFVCDLNGDLDTDLTDFAIFALYWQNEYDSAGIKTVRDEFNAVSYSGNDGTNNWSNGWQELGESDGPSRGLLQVISDGQMQIGAVSRPFASIRSLTREANLSGASTATLTYDYVAQNNRDAGNVSVQVSGDGGLNWSTLANYSYDAGSGWASFDITPYISSNTQIRFETSSEMKMYLYVDNIQIEYDDPERPWYPWSNGCDFNRDWRIDFGDLLIFCEHWLE